MNFEAYTAVNGWSEENKGLFILAVSLCGHAQSVLGDLPSSLLQNTRPSIRGKITPPIKLTDLYHTQIKERNQKASEYILN